MLLFVEVKREKFTMNKQTQFKMLFIGTKEEKEAYFQVIDYKTSLFHQLIFS